VTDYQKKQIHSSKLVAQTITKINKHKVTERKTDRWKGRQTDMLTRNYLSDK